MHRVFYRLVVTLVTLLVRSGRDNDLEIVVLRHQLMVLPTADVIRLPRCDGLINEYENAA